jgi:crotonobetainyl-CoA:carnitine CoA-transferase CaiB-like acyl-CoA transferase
MTMLDGIRVLSFNHFLLGPMGMQVLGDLGADVIAVEPVSGGFQRKWSGANRRADGESLLHLCANRNKRNIAIDLKSEEGKEVVHRLIAKSDVICENFRPGVMDKFGFGYEDAKKINAGVIYASASGYGGDGPYRERPGQDLVVQAMSGLAMINGNDQQAPIPVGVSAVDHHGAQILAMAILAALVRRGRTGEGCRVEVDLLSAGLDIQCESLVCWANGEPVSLRPPANIAGWYYAAPYGIYETADGHMAISLGAMETLATAIDLPALADFSDAETFSRNREIAALIQTQVAGWSNDEIEARLEAQSLWYARVNDYAAVMTDPQVVHNGSFMTVDGANGEPITLLGHPARYDGKRPGVRRPPQPIGAQTAEVLGEIGYDDAAIAAMAGAGSIAVSDS